jgi:hypothetical protein
VPSPVKSNGVASPKGLGWFSGSEYRGRVLLGRKYLAKCNK